MDRIKTKWIVNEDIVILVYLSRFIVS